MSFRNSGRALRILVLAAVCALPALSAHASPLDGARFREDRSIFTAFVAELRGFWQGLWGQEGITIDPDGKPNGTTPPPSGTKTDEGITIDPNG